MGAQLTQHKKVITLPNLQQQLQACTELNQRQCPIYGTLHLISYKDYELQIGKNQNTTIPTQESLHYIIQPSLIVLPPHCLLQKYKINQYTCKKQILDIIVGICQLQQQVEVGLGRNRVAQANGRWVVYGEVGNPMWGYQMVVKDGANCASVYFSPEMMYALSKNKLYPKIDFRQSDVFVLAVMLLQIMAQQNLQSLVYNYTTCQIKLGPILQSLMGVEERFGKQIYELIVKMLELQPQARFTFSELKQQALRISNDQSCYLSPITSKITNLTPPPNVKPKSDSFNPSPSPSPQQLPKSGFDEQSRGRSPGAIRKNLPLLERQNGKKSFSPIKHAVYDGSVDTQQRNSLLSNVQKSDQDRRKRVSNVYKITPNRVKVWQGMQKQRPKVEPFGLRFTDQSQYEEQQSKGQKKSFSKLKAIRF